MTSAPQPPGPDTPPKIDTSVAHSARIWNYWLGGKAPPHPLSAEN